MKGTVELAIKRTAGNLATAVIALEGFPTLEEWGRIYIEEVLDATRGDRTRAAEILGINRRTLYRKGFGNRYAHVCPPVRHGCPECERQG